MTNNMDTNKQLADRPCPCDCHDADFKGWKIKVKGPCCTCRATTTPEIKHHSLSPGATLPTYYTGGSMVEIVPEHSLDFSEAESVPAQEDWENKFIERFGYIEQKGRPVPGEVLVFIRQQIAQAREDNATVYKIREEAFEEGRRALREEILKAIEYTLPVTFTAEECRIALRRFITSKQ